MADLTPRHYQIAALLATGRSEDEIADVMNVSKASIRGICASPLFKTLAQQMIRDVGIVATRDAVNRIAVEGPNSVETIVDIRDHGTSEDGVRLGAAKDLLDRNPLTARFTRSQDERAINVVVSDELLRRATAVIAEDEGRPIDAKALPARTPKVRTLEESLADNGDGDRETP